MSVVVSVACVDKASVDEADVDGSVGGAGVGGTGVGGMFLRPCLDGIGERDGPASSDRTRGGGCQSQADNAIHILTSGVTTSSSPWQQSLPWREIYTMLCVHFRCRIASEDALSPGKEISRSIVFLVEFPALC